MKVIKIETVDDIPENYTGMAECPDGTKFWLLNGKYHKENGPAIESSNGEKHWCINGKYHREDGPAIVYLDGTKLWLLNGKYHREDGPAVEDANNFKGYWLDGKILNREKIECLINLGYPESIAIKLSNL